MNYCALLLVGCRDWIVSYSDLLVNLYWLTLIFLFGIGVVVGLRLSGGRVSMAQVLSWLSVLVTALSKLFGMYQRHAKKANSSPTDTPTPPTDSPS